VHLEATVEPGTLLAMARRNGEPLPADTVEGLRDFCRFTGFPHFVEVWIATTNVMRTCDDFRRVVTDYAERVAAAGCVYVEGIFSPAERVRRGVRRQELFEGYCDGATEAWERHGVQVRLTPDITRDFPLGEAWEVVEWATRYRERGVVGVGLGGSEQRYPPEPFAPVFARVREEGLGSVPHAGETRGPRSVRAALDVLGADRIRHGVRAVEDAGLVRDLAQRGIVLDVTPVSNVRTGVVRSVHEHPLRELAAAGVRCSVSSDDPVLMATSLEENAAAAAALGVPPRRQYFDALAGVLCEPAVRERLRALGEACDWEGVSA
jgi:aminodeoxyfutalosine deaminase